VADRLAEEIATRLTAGEGNNALIPRLQTSPDPLLTVRELARHEDGDVRDWAIGTLADMAAAGDVSKAEAVELIRHHAFYDRDADIRDDATRLLLRLEPEAGRELIPRLRARLRSKDYYLPVSAMWQLLELGDRQAVPLIEAFRDRMGTRHWKGKQAEIVLRLYAEDDEWLADRIVGHDHDMMHVLCRAAGIRRSPQLIEAVRRCVAAAFDPDCNRVCESAWDGLRTADT
jgi:hypothetical protein